MSRSLISFLGRVVQPPRQYQSARYDFGGGRATETRFFGHALCQELGPDRFTVLGTSASMWDVLVEALAPGDEFIERVLDLGDAAAKDEVSQGQLSALEAPLGERMGLSVQLRLIEYGRTPEEQLSILKILAGDLRAGDSVAIDVTHGLRHLPMLALVSALYVRSAKGVAIDGIYYGALDMTRDGLTPVMRLDGLLDIVDWVGALQAYDKDGDYAVFAPLLRRDEVSQGAVANLERASYAERTNRVGTARGHLEAFAAEVLRGASGPLPGISDLFQGELQQRISWTQRDHLYQRQRDLAQMQLARGDYLRASVFAYEAFITRLVQQDPTKQPDNTDHRAEAKKLFVEASPRPGGYRHFALLRDIRNLLAHGGRPMRGPVFDAMRSPEALRATLERLIQELLAD